MHTKFFIRLLLSLMLAASFFPLSYASASQLSATNPSLSLSNLSAGTNETVVMPVAFDPGTYSVSAVVFSIDFDQTMLSFDATDGNSDGVPDSVIFNVPASFSVSASYDPTDTDGEIDVVIADYSPPLSALPAGNIVTVEFITGISSGIASVRFSTDPPPSFGTTSGSGIGGNITHGSISIGSGGDYKVYLPTILYIIPTTYTISGTIKDSGNSPLSGVTVSTGGTSTTTDGSGNYTLTLPTGSYTLTATKSGYSCSAGFSQPVNLPPSLTGKNFTCTAGITTYSISGQVTAGGLPLAGVVVSAGSKNATSDASGNYTITEVPAGSYTLTASKSGYSCSAGFSQPVSLPPSLTGKNFTCTVNPTYMITGTIRDEGGNPMTGVTVTLEGVTSFTTNSSGQYTFSGLGAGSYKVTPSYQGYAFTPASRTIVVPPNAANQDFTAVNSLILNGSFESDTAWIFPDTEYTGGYSTQQAHTGGRSARVGIITPADNKYSYSSVYQAVNIPSSLSEVTLNCFLYTKSTEAKLQSDVSITQRGIRPEAVIMAYDMQYVMILDANYNILATLWSSKTNNPTWVQHTFDLSDYISLSSIKGKTIYVYFGAYNDGYGGVTGMYVDDVTLRITP
ncbi:MAG TPA: carboxypeptidase regulatory-like domain-containing protein [Longilinea sp.]|nr:carboxypeptidase regulatory-like domain-containing protein [Longilinea sp.]